MSALTPARCVPAPGYGFLGSGFQAYVAGFQAYVARFQAYVAGFQGYNAGLQAYDGWSTVRAVRLGASEANPAVAGIASHAPAMWQAGTDARYRPLQSPPSDREAGELTVPRAFDASAETVPPASPA